MEITQKRILGLLLSVALLFTALPMTAMAQEELPIQDSGQPLSLAIGVSNVSENRAEIDFSASMNGTVYYTVYPSEEQPPEEAVLLTKETVAVTEGSAVVVVEGLTAQTSYIAYGLFENVAGNRSAVAVAQFTTKDEAAMASTPVSPIPVEPQTTTGPALSLTPGYSAGDPVPYLDDKGKEQTSTSYKILTAEYLSGNSEVLTGGWYVVDSVFTYDNRITTSGDVHIILTDSANMTAGKGITAEGVNSLTIYGQAKGTGKLIATGQYKDAGIGGGSSGMGGTITINGGTVNATSDRYGAGIGGGNYRGGGTTIINGGTVTATSNCSAGIGGGFDGEGGTIIIGGGTVTAIGGSNSTGIGGSNVNAGMGTIIIRGGTVTTTGGYYAPGISGIITISGGSVTATGGEFGAGIGGSGLNHEGGTIIISGGTVTAKGGSYGAGIGGGFEGEGGTITISGGTVSAIGGKGYSVATHGYCGGGAGIGSGGGFSNSPASGSITITGAANITAQGGAGDGSTTNKSHSGAGIGSGGAAGTGNSVGSVGAITINTMGTVKATGGAGDNNGVNPGADIGEGGSQSGPGTELFGGSVPYLDDKGVEQTRAIYTKLTAEYLLNNSATLIGGWYVVDSTFTYGNRITISGDVHIILTDSADVNASKGITVTGSNSLTLYGQSGGTGKLTATDVNYDDAGIGGGSGCGGGTITINGGTVTATGGQMGAGIGGGRSSLGGKITINGGTVNAAGLNGAGIGGGGLGEGGIITINGGMINATAKYSGSGIGGGADGAGGAITINGGMVNATVQYGGAGIGGGLGGGGGTITISGNAEIKATGGIGFAQLNTSYGGGAGIGSGGGYGNSPVSGSITITGSANITAQGGAGNGSTTIKNHSGAGIGSGGAAGTGDSGSSVGIITINTTGTVKATGGAGDNKGVNPGADIGAGGSYSGTGKPYYTITIDNQPVSNTTVTQGSITESLSVAASVLPKGAPAYEWFSNNTNSNTGGVTTGVKTPSFTIPADLAVGDYYYYCVVSGVWAASVPSNVATVRVTVPPPMTYTVTYNLNGGDGTIPIETPKAQNATFTAAAITGITPPTGKQFKEWNTAQNGSGTAYTPGATVTMPGAALMLYVIWEDIPTPITHIITASGAANGSISPSGNVSVIKGTNQTFAIMSNSPYSIRDVKVDGISVGVVSSYTFSNVTQNHTIHAEFYYSYSGSNGGSRGDMITPSKKVTTDKQPNMPTVAKMRVLGTVKDGILSGTITEQITKDGIKAAQDAAKKSGKEVNGIALDFEVTGKGSYTNLNATIDAGVIDQLKEAGVKFAKIGSAVLDITLDTEAITDIHRQSRDMVMVSAMMHTKLSQTAKALIGYRPVFNITISYQKKGKTEYVTNLSKGIVTLGIAYEATEKENKGNLFGVYIDKNGKPQLLTNSSYDNTGRLIFSPNSLSTYGIGYKAPAPAFNDTAKHWGKDNIDFVVSRNLISGISTTIFAPNTAITRGDFLMGLGRLSGADVSIFKTSSFTDVKSTYPAMPYIEWGVKNKIMQGISNDRFEPDKQISRQDMAVIMLNYVKATGYKLPVSIVVVKFADNAKIAAYAKDTVVAIQQSGVMQGKGNNDFDPQGSATRAEASTILRRFVELVINEGTARGWSQNHAGQWQHIGENGKPTIGWLTAQSGKYDYYFIADGIMVAGKWLEIDDKWYYFNADGSLAKNAKIDDYEVDENGVRKVMSE